MLSLFFSKIVEWLCSIDQYVKYGQYVRNNARVYMVATLYFEGGVVSHKASVVRNVQVYKVPTNLYFRLTKDRVPKQICSRIP